MTRTLLSIAAVFLFAVLSAPCGAWNKAAHMLSGAVAYNELAEGHPEVVAQVMALMKDHPQATQFEAELAGLNSEAEQAQALFMYMARWADDMRGQIGYDHPKWHYVNIPYVPSETVDRSNEAPLDAENILSAATTNIGVIRDPHSAPSDKAIALCWLFHQVGDLHQPLHVVSMITPELPEGDRGGNLIFVRPNPNAAPVRLHAFWDNAASHTDQPMSVSRLARRLSRLPSFERAAFQELQERPYTDELAFERWAREESYPLAVQVAYQGGTLGAAYSEERAVVLSSFYVASAKELSLRRVVLSGYRLADVLAALFPATSGASTAPQGQSDSVSVPEENLLRARLKEFWQAVGARDIVKRYEMTTPTVRERVTLEEFRKTWSWQERTEFPWQNMTAELSKVCSCVELRLLRCTLSVEVTIKQPGEAPVRERTAQMWEFADGQWYEAYSGAPSGRHCPGEG
jgi:S1/P1 nuclease